MKKTLKIIGIILLFTVITIIFFRNVFFKPGVIAGYDWGLPYTLSQIDQAYKNSVLTWSNQGMIFGTRYSFFASAWFPWLTKLLSIIGLGIIYTKLVLFFLFVFAGLSMYSLARFFKFNTLVSIFAGLFYITSPLFFDYSIMGWTYVLFALCLLPLTVKYFIKSVKESKMKYSVIAGILYAISIIQSQSLIWFMVVFIMLAFYLIKDKKSLFTYIKSLSFILITFFLINAYWIIGLLLVPDRQTFDNTVIASSVSVGSMGHFYPLNIVRLWGGLANFEYENATNLFPILIFISFLVPFLAISSLLIKKNNKLIFSFYLIAFFPIVIYFLNYFRYLLVYIPFAAGIRDFARFTVLSTFAYPILAAFSLEYILKKFPKIIFFLFLILWFISISPWWTSEISKWTSGSGCNGRIRTKVFPKEYLELEQLFNNKLVNQKAFYFPTGGIIQFYDDPRFYWACNEIWDLFAGGSPIPGGLTMLDRNKGYLAEYLNEIKDNLYNKNLLKILQQTNIKYFVVRKNLLSKEQQSLIMANLKSWEKQKKIYKYLENNKIVIYARTNYLPYFYIPSINILSKNPVKNISNDVKDLNKLTSAIFYQKQNQNNLNLLNEIDYRPNDQSTIVEYKKITPYKYRIVLHKLKKSSLLIFNEAYHDQWKIYIKKFNVSPIQNVKNYQISKTDKDEQASIEEIQKYINNGWISNIGDKQTSFISKENYNSIQNNNLMDGKFYESWLTGKYNQDLIEIPKNYHLTANAYANSWSINPDEICDKTTLCKKNSDGSYDIEVIVEFYAQKIFFIGSFVSLTTLLFLLVLILLPSKKKLH